MSPIVVARPQVPSPELHHLKPLDGIRGLAVLGVILSHAFESNFFAHSLPIRLVGLLFYLGHFGVDLFFVLSGFLITGILIDTRADTRYFRRFYARRTLRIFPLYYGVLFVLIGLTLPLHLNWNGMLPFLLTYTQNFRPFAIDSLALSSSIALYHLWSLAVEEQFYLVWPLAVYFLRGRKALLIGTLAGIVLSIALRCTLLIRGVDWRVLHVSTPTRADTLLIGALLAIAYRSEIWERLQRFAPAIFIVLIPVLCIPAASIPIVIGGLRETLIALCFAALLAWSIKPASAAKWLFERTWLRFLGKYSYGIYVLHVFIVTPLVPILRPRFQQLTHSKLLAVIVTGIICLSLSILAAWLSFNLYEKSFLRLKRYFQYGAIAPPDVNAVLPAAHSAGAQSRAVAELESPCRTAKSRTPRLKWTA